jgi:hypothetical protein
LFVTLCDTVLGLGPEDDNARFIAILGIFAPRS